ncbi:hypothetical protein BJ170DRAFT_589069, partial [Xylariales sp. AK1849]
VKIRARDIRNIIKEKFPELTLTSRDIYNVKIIINRENFGNYRPIITLIKLFDDESILYIIK